ncbi:MAG: type II 3-dehydroquinate dehydratase [Deltaproteobacteria bacterium]|nr:type II 3-dehydroquinate dehydratase [Deltaproteobacteria bacterium]
MGQEPPKAPVDSPAATHRVLVIHGPNLNLLGARETHVYGSTTLSEIDTELRARGARLGVSVETFQSNVEGEIVTRIQEARGRFDGILINPAAYTHTSIAICDALLAVGLPAVEVHLSNLHRREPFRQKTVTAAACVGQVCGFGAASYYVALEGIVLHLRGKEAHAKPEKDTP